MANTKEYKIVINGITESVKAVESLNRELASLEARINALNSKAVKISASSTGGGYSSGGGGSKSSSKSALSEEEKLAKQIEQIDAKRVAYSKEIYQSYLAAKDILGETVKDQKAIAAAERLQAKAYSNTMLGMKQELADIKEAMQTVDLGDTKQFEEMTRRANELNEALKKIEESYGQFGRNVGNYKSAFDGLDKVKVTIDGVAKEFDNLRQATTAIKNAMGALDAAGKKDTKMYKDLEKELERVSKAQLRLNSAMKDAKASSKVMDDLLDTMESFTAIGHLTQSFSTLFGFDDSEIEKQIAKLVALQGTLKDIEKIRQQFNTQEGIGKYFSIASKGVDQFVAKLAGADYRMGKIIGSTKEASRNLMIFSNVLKGFGGVAITGGFILLANIVGNLIEQFKKWYTGGIEAGDATKILESSVSALDESYQRLLDEDVDSFFSGQAKESSVAKNAIEALTRKMLELLYSIEDVNGALKEFKPGSTIATWNTKNLDDGRRRFQEIAKEIEKIEKESKESVLGETITGWFKGLNGKKRDLKELGNILAEDFGARAKNIIEKAREETLKYGYVIPETARELKYLKNEMYANPTTKGILDNIEMFSNNSPIFVRNINAVKTSIEQLSNAVSEVDPSKLEQYAIDAMGDSEAKIKRQNALNRKKELESVNFNPAYTEAINKKYDQELKENLKAYRNSKKSETDQKKREERQAQDEIDELKLQLMREGLEKEMEALQKERDRKLRDIADSGIKVQKRTNLTNEVYDKKILELRRQWAREMVEIYEKMYGDIEDVQKEARDRELNTESLKVKNVTGGQKQEVWKGVIDVINPTDIQNRVDYYNKLLEIDKNALNEEQKIKEQQLKNELEDAKKQEEIRHKNIVDAETVSLIAKELSSVPEGSEADYAEMEKRLQDTLANMKGELVDAYNEGKMDFKDFVELVKQEQIAFNNNMDTLEKENAQKLIANTKEGLEQTQQLYSNYYTNLLATVRQRQDNVARVIGKQPEVDDTWGVVKISRTKENYKAAIEEYQSIANNVKQIKAKLKNDLDKNNITADEFLIKSQEIDSIEKSLEDATKETLQKQKQLGADFVNSIMKYVQQGIQSLNTIMQAIWDAQDAQFDKEQEEIDKNTEKIQEALQKEEDLVQSHKEKINSLEDELATARGDRRQHLIDQINAEMEAERQAAKQAEKLKREEEAQKKKEEELEKKRKKAQYKRDMAQAVVNGAMAVTMAAVNNWPMPAIAMMALAAATTAAQIAIMSANKPYAKGGLLEGPSHKQGGIPVGNTGIEVEGKEYVIRKKSTTPNVELLDYINKSERRLNLDDFIDFYSSGKIKKTISSISPRSAFADGGVIPTINNDYSFDDRLINAFEDYSNRPVYVTVKDINERQAAVKNVQVLAGLE